MSDHDHGGIPESPAAKHDHASVGVVAVALVIVMGAAFLIVECRVDRLEEYHLSPTPQAEEAK